MGLANKIGNALSDFWSRNDLEGIDTPIQFKEKMDSFSSISKTVAFNRIPKDVLSETQVEEFHKNYYEYFGAPESPGLKMLEELSNQYKECHHMLEQAMKVKTENLHMDFIERMRFLCFRILTAVGIAAVILGTSYLAKLWQIPIPMLRIAG